MSDWITATATIVLAVITGYYAYLTHKIAAAGKVSAEAARESAAHAARAADVAEESVRHAARSAGAAERALLADSMPTLVLRRQDSVAYLIFNAGAGVAIDGVATFKGEDYDLPVIEPGKYEPGVISRAVVRSGDVESIVPIVYEDSIGSRFRSETTIIVDEGGADVVKLEVEIWDGERWRMLTAR